MDRTWILTGPPNDDDAPLYASEVGSSDNWEFTESNEPDPTGREEEEK